MEKYVWLFPIIFIVHDMEEIIGFGIWLKKNKALLDEKYPSISKTYKDFSTEGFSLAVLEELILCIILCLLALFTGNSNKYIWCIWLGGFIACTLHFVIHIGQAIIMRQYIPATITSILFLPVSIWIIIKSIAELSLQATELIIFSVIGIIIVALNLKLAQSLIGKFTRKMKL